MGSVIRPCLPSQYSVRPARSSTECRAKKSRSTRALVASSATALAPFSQNSAVCRWSGSGSGQAQDMQSKPSVWLSLSSVFAVRAGPIWLSARFIETATAVTPAAAFFGPWTSTSFSSMSWWGVCLAIPDPPRRRASSSLYHPANFSTARADSP